MSVDQTKRTTAIKRVKNTKEEEDDEEEDDQGDFDNLDGFRVLPLEEMSERRRQ